jgi:hypothetical protein
MPTRRLKGAMARRRLVLGLAIGAVGLLSLSNAWHFSRDWGRAEPVAAGFLRALTLCLLGLAAYLIARRLRFGVPTLVLDSPPVFGEASFGTLNLPRVFSSGSVLSITLEGELKRIRLGFFWGLELQQDRLQLWREEKAVDLDGVLHDASLGVPVSFRLPSVGQVAVRSWPAAKWRLRVVCRDSSIVPFRDEFVLPVARAARLVRDLDAAALITQRVDELAAALGASLVTKGRDRSFNLHHAGMPFSVRVRVARNSEEILVLAEAGPRPRLRLRRKSSIDRLGRRLAFEREHQTGDPAFDRDVSIDTDLPVHVVREAVSEQALHRSVRDLLAAGFDNLDFDEKGLTLRKDFQGFQDLEPERFRGFLDAAASAASRMRSLDRLWAEFPSRRTPAVVTTAAIIVAVTGVIATVLARKLWRTLSADPVVSGLRLGLLLTVLSLPLLLLLLRGRVSGMRDAAVSGLGLLIGLPCWGVAGLTGVNGLLDDSPAVVREAVITGKDTGGTSKSREYSVSLRWPDGKFVKLDVSRARYDAAEVGAVLPVVTRRGSLGWEWMVSAP